MCVTAHRARSCADVHTPRCAGAPLVLCSPLVLTGAAVLSYRQRPRWIDAITGCAPWCSAGAAVLVPLCSADHRANRAQSDIRTSRS